ncbi:DUF1648 domain-containing protein [Nesterenkonia ebinurensis]|uniref:DUF1648 domain-containing protein n=1 Tax=Nesterenkonia ebinurensis TaxID=2608252 RepID=UPI00123D9861|nr:DUF1648 domain-containing protein [Nesterenkonia ebinurensis]
MTAGAAELRPPIPYRGRRVLWGVVVPFAITAGAFALLLSWLPRLPDQVVLQWGPEGTPSRLGSVWELIGISGSFAVLSSLVLAGCALFTGRTGFIRRIVLGLATGQSLLFAGIMVDPLAHQLDLPEGDAPAYSEWGLLMVLTVALAGGILAATLAGADPRQPSDRPVTGEQAELAPDERAVWVKGLTPGGRFLSVFAAVAVVYFSLMGAMAWWAQSWFTLLVSLLPVPLTAVMFAWRVRVDSRGLTASSALGWPKLHVPADEVEGAEAGRVESPMGEFGGWGIRSSLSEPDGTVGVVIRGGEALVVSRSGGRKVVVTVDDAATAAALLNTKAARARQS